MLPFRRPRYKHDTTPAPPFGYLRGNHFPFLRHGRDIILFHYTTSPKNSQYFLRNSHRGKGDFLMDKIGQAPEISRAPVMICYGLWIFRPRGRRFRLGVIVPPIRIAFPVLIGRLVLCEAVVCNINIIAFTDRKAPQGLRSTLVIHV